MCFKKSDTFSLICFPRSLSPLILKLIYPYRSLLLALILSFLFYTSYFKGDINAIFLKRLIKAIFLFKGAKNVFLIVSYCHMCHVGQGSEYHVTDHVTDHV